MTPLTREPLVADGADTSDDLVSVNSSCCLQLLPVLAIDGELGSIDMYGVPRTYTASYRAFIRVTQLLGADTIEAVL